MSASARRSTSPWTRRWSTSRPEPGEGPGLYLLDEPTVGLHFTDVQRLLEVLDGMIQRGDTET